MIRAENLVKAYGERKAVDGVSFEVRAGECFGFLGPNGAGKTTTSRMLVGLTNPTSGSVRVAGFDPATEPLMVHRNIGVVFEAPNLYERLTAADNLLLFAKLNGLSADPVKETLERLGLGERSKDSVSKFSKGMKQRVLIGRALLHKPKVLFLDEPTSGLDPASALMIREIVRDLQEKGTTIFLTTHYMEEADELCDRVAFIESGKIAAVDTPINLKLLYGEKRLKIELKGDNGETVEHIKPMDDPETGLFIADAIRSGTLSTVHSQEASLADVFIKLTGRSLR